MPSTSEPAYPAPALCEGRSRVWSALTCGWEEGRCQRAPVAWNEDKYRWVCGRHNRKTKTSPPAPDNLLVFPADDDIGLGVMIMRLPTGRKTTPTAISLTPEEVVWLIEQLQATQHTTEGTR